ncbi:sensor histidine kinase [Protaetiibacter larvae]|uniref:histidine kinase n=1 Tax=Protaetiibacter larvae TaxID=2592654 RepID=A0A5C1YAI6_9MICO|nr:sensor histidine kinase [Protaetiibacter larvae]QEO10235.1 sensor histidine kinase [Protaetiibacter larvae]
MPRPPEHPGAQGGAEWGGGPWAWGDPERSWGPSRRLRLWVPVVLSALVQLPAATIGVRIAQPEPWIGALTIALAAVGPLALIAARRLPGPVVAVATAAAVGELLVGVNGGPPPIALAFALVGAIVRGARGWAWISLAAGWSVALVAGILVTSETWTPPRVVGTTLVLLLVMGIGEGIRSRRERVREYRAAAVRKRLTAAEEERMRIARELHDVLAHSLSQINVQAGVGLHLADTRPEQAVEALASIKQTSKTALDEVRAVLGVLRADGEGSPLAPQPGIGDIPALVAGAGIPGARVELVDELRGVAVSTAAGAAAYRIVQEALTNAARHGVGVSSVRVRLADEAGRLMVEVRDDGRVGAVEPGRGLLGMRERAELLGGRFELGTDGGFTVRAELPREAR